MQLLQNTTKELPLLLKHMHSVIESKEQLDDLSRNWDTLALLSQIGDAGMNMDKIKSDFVSLSDELINHLGGELLCKVVAEMDSKAQVCVDIVIRNLFERTADIGFLATDGAIRDFLIKFPTKYTPHAQESALGLKKRFIEYAKKYSVYSDIVLMNPQGEILARIDSSNTTQKSHDSIVKEVSHTHEDYVESYKTHDFLSAKRKTLVYSYKVTESSEPNAPIIGVLALCFRFEDEMQGIFKNLLNPKTKECITLLDAKGTVIASSDKYHVPLGASLEVVLDVPYKIVTFGGRDYLAKSSKTKGYQGFYGLGWCGHVMVPLESAFSAFDAEDFEITQALLLAILQHSDLFSSRLKAIPLQASSIQHNLNRAIWNGNVKQNNSHNENKQFSRALLQEIKKTGERTKEIIAESMAKLTKTMALSDSTLLADLIVDIMDRNLYERANDCRWWALTPDFRLLLSGGELTTQDSLKMSNILAHINKLYTVYTNLFVYDAKGLIVAVSQKSQQHLVGMRLTKNWVEESLALSETSKYSVSDFEKSPLYENEHTYIYNAAIRSHEDASVVVGGIGIVFDAKLQFAQMIEESLPKKSTEHTDALFCVLATQEQKIIASNNSQLRIGERFIIDSKFFMLKNGESLSEIVEYEGDYYALGVKCSKGYREYKSASDEYVNNIYSFVFSYISNVAQTRLDIEEPSRTKEVGDVSREIDTLDIATFMIGEKWLGIPTHDVVEAVNIVSLSSAVKMDEEHHFKGTMLYRDSVVSVIDISKFIQGEIASEYEEIIVIKFGKNGYIGILASSLGSIASVKEQEIRPLDEYIIGNGTLIESVVFPSKGDLTQEALSILNVQKIHKNLVQPNLTHMTKKFV